MNDKPNPITHEDLERGLTAMSEPSNDTGELWREALHRVRREDARGTRQIPGRRRVLGVSAAVAAVLALGVSVMLVLNGLGGGLGEHRGSAPVRAESAGPHAAAASTDLAGELDAMLLADAHQRDMLQQREAFAAEPIDGAFADRGGGRDLGRTPSTEGARASRLRDEVTMPRAGSAAEQSAPLALGAPADERSADNSAERSDALADTADAAETELAPVAARPMLEKSADLKLEADDVDEAMTRAASLVDPALGEYVVLSRISGEGPGRRAAVSLRVSSSRFEAVIDRLRQLGEVVQIESAATDLSAQAADLNDRLALAVETERDILERFETLKGPLASETQEARRQIRGARGEVDQLRSELRSIESRTAWASVRVLFAPALPTPEPAPEPGFLDRLGASAGDGLSALQDVAVWLTRALIASAPIVAVLGLIGWLIYRRLTRR